MSRHAKWIAALAIAPIAAAVWLNMIYHFGLWLGWSADTAAAFVLGTVVIATSAGILRGMLDGA